MTPILQTRREFLSTGLKGLGLVAAGGWVPSFVARTALAARAETDTRVLVILQLGGGNDGLNTVVPFTDDRYHAARPTLALSADEVLRVGDHLGFHPALRPVAGLFDDGKFAVVQGVGYPNPDRSHFRSMEIWHTAAREGHELRGWLGRYFDAQCAGADPQARLDISGIGMSFGKVMPQAFRNRSNVSLALDNPDTFQWNPSGETPGLARAQVGIFANVNRPGGTASRGLDALGGIAGTEPETVDFLRHTAMNAVVSGDRIRRILDRRVGADAYPNSALGSQMRMVSRLISGGFPTRVYYASQGGYDTHSGQAGTHANLLADMAQSLSAFHGDLRRQNLSDRVLLVAFSEFGRRVAENGSEGTDHGAAAPMFVLGDAIKGGLHGKHPDLGDLENGDVRHGIDFRQVYATVIERWLGLPQNKVLKEHYEPLAFL